MRKLPSMLRAVTIALAVVVLAACAPAAAPTQTPVPAKPAAAPTTAPAPAKPAPTTAPAAAAPAKPSPGGAPAAAAQPAFGADGKLQRLPDGFPSGPITIWNTFPPGHSDEVYARVMVQAGQKLSPVPLVVQSKSAGPRIQWEVFDHLKTLPNATDGQHVVVWALSSMPVRLRTLDVGNWKLQDGINSVVLNTEEEPPVLASRADASWNDLDGMVKWAKDNPGKLRIATSGLGSQVHMNSEILASIRDFKYVPLPHDGVGQAQQTLLGGGAEVMTTMTSQIRPLLSGNRVKVFMQWGASRSPVFKDVPTSKDLKVGGVAVTRGISSYPATSEAHKAWLRALFEKAAKEPEYQERLKSLGLTERIAGPKEIAEELLAEDKEIAPIIEKLGLAKKG